MGDGFDISGDRNYETGIGNFANNTPADFGGDLAGNTGVDLNGYTGSSSDTGMTGRDTFVQGEDLNDDKDARLDSILDSFQNDKWKDLSLDEQKQSMTDLANFVAETTDNQNPPTIIFRGDMNDGEYGGYDPESNTLEINENMLDDSSEAADTVAHEMWHAYQQQCALDPSSEKGREYQEGFDNYISPEYDFEGYQNQMVEAEARQFAQGFKDRITGRKGAA